MLEGLLILFVVGAGILIIYNLPWFIRYARSRIYGHKSRIKTPVITSDEGNEGVINALVITSVAYEFRKLVDDVIKSLYTGWYSYNNHNVIICQEDKNDLLIKWEPSNKTIHPEDTAIKTRTPQQLFQMIDWIHNVTRVYSPEGDNQGMLNMAMYVTIFGVLILLAFVLYTGNEDEVAAPAAYLNVLLGA